MKHSEMKEMFLEEVTWLEDLTAYERDLVPCSGPEMAKQMIEDWKNDGWDLPEGFLKSNAPALVLALWNEFITPSEEDQKRISQEKYEEDFIRDHPDWMHFDGYYSDGSCLFLDPDAISNMLIRNHYDEEHRELIAKALMAYYKTYQQNL